MPSKTYTDNTGSIDSDWLNPVNNWTYGPATKTIAKTLTPEDGVKIHPQGTDGGPFIGGTGKADGYYDDDGGTAYGTRFKPTGGDGTAGWERAARPGEKINVRWFLATGDDDTVDETLLFQAAVDAAYVSVNFDNKSVFVPTPIDGYKVTALTGYGRVELHGENMWSTRIVVSAAGDYGASEFRYIEGIWFDGAVIANGANRIDEAAWTSAADRANTGIIMGSATEAYQFGHAIVRRCRFSALGVSVERNNSINTSIKECYMSTVWHGIFNRATQFASMLRDNDNYIQNLSGIGIGFYASSLGYNNWNFDGSVVEFCCKDVAHNGINGFIDIPATVKSPSGKSVYLEVDEGTYPNAIGIRSNVIALQNFWFQGFENPIKAISTSSFWNLENGEIIEGTGTYDLTIPVIGGRNTFKYIAFTNGLNPAALGFTTISDCSNSGILPDGNSNKHYNDGNLYIDKQAGFPLTLNRRSTDGGNIDLQRQGTSVNELQTTTLRSQWSKPHGIPVYTIVTLPSAVSYKDCLIMISDEVGGYTLASSDGTNWRRASDRAIAA